MFLPKETDDDQSNTMNVFIPITTSMQHFPPIRLQYRRETGNPRLETTNIDFLKAKKKIIVSSYQKNLNGNLKGLSTLASMTM